jgi:hypothetical protein
LRCQGVSGVWVPGSLQGWEAYILLHGGPQSRRLSPLGPKDVVAVREVGAGVFRNSRLPHCWEPLLKASGLSTIFHLLNQLNAMARAAYPRARRSKSTKVDPRHRGGKWWYKVRLPSLAATIAVNPPGLLYFRLRLQLTLRSPPSHSPDLYWKARHLYRSLREFLTLVLLLVRPSSTELPVYTLWILGQYSTIRGNGYPRRRPATYTSYIFSYRLVEEWACWNTQEAFN